MALSPASSALCASAAAKSPGTESSARLASGSTPSALRSLRARRSGSAPSPGFSASMARASRSAPAASAPRTALIRSFASARSPSAASSPASRSSALFDGAPIITPPASTPPTAPPPRPIRPTPTQSRYSLFEDLRVAPVRGGVGGAAARTVQALRHLDRCGGPALAERRDANAEIGAVAAHRGDHGAIVVAVYRVEDALAHRHGDVEEELVVRSHEPKRALGVSCSG